MNQSDTRAIQTRALGPADADWAAALVRDRWLGPFLVTRGRIHDTRDLPGIVACENGEPVGLLLYANHGDDIEIVTLDALEHRRGVGRCLLAAIRRHAFEQGATRVWLITTNDNLPAIVFYTACGFRLVAVHLDAVEAARALKPHIPLIGQGGVPLRDELEFSATPDATDAPAEPPPTEEELTP